MYNWRHGSEWRTNLPDRNLWCGRGGAGSGGAVIGWGLRNRKNDRERPGGARVRESGAEGSEGRAKLRDERHSHVIRERKRHRARARWGSFVFAKPSPRPQSIFSCKTFAITLYNTENLGYSINFTVMSLFQVSFQVPPSSPHSAKVISSLLPPEASPEYWPTAATIGKSCSHIGFFCFFLTSYNWLSTKRWNIRFIENFCFSVWCIQDCLPMQ